MSSNDQFGDRMKEYEKEYTSAYVSVDKILCVRIDGRGFSKFTKNFKKPFDSAITDLMIKTTEYLVKETHAKIGFTQSDEITLIYTPGEKSSEYVFGGKVSKINSVFASMATAAFNSYNLLNMSPAYADQYMISPQEYKLAIFDCRSWAVPDLTEASNVLLWRAQDARKNSISAAFRWMGGGHKKMQNLNGQEMIDLLKEYCGEDWDDIPNEFRFGTFIKPVKVLKELTPEELEKIPATKRPNDNKVERTEVQEIIVGYFGDLSLQDRMRMITD